MAALTDKLAKPAIRIESLFFIVYFLSLSNQSEDLVRSVGIVNEVFIWSMKTPSGFPRLEVRSSLVDESITIFFLLEAATVSVRRVHFDCIVNLCLYGFTDS
ncbi:Uncharacterised protein [Vibrio cholerae]|uniref:Uncharacterized protein n=1 Tax=Vibrio cholerae TaxID=666 RepID=A0A656AIT1_VIBCL|nr:Uncharacterised protein [Vibrio cholerae]CSD00311.1 Uncharacterised protein [Vibrio cholerae]CSD16994.1 Uncharacterised protein [Vibrio cholerae]